MNLGHFGEKPILACETALAIAVPPNAPDSGCSTRSLCRPTIGGTNTIGHFGAGSRRFEPATPCRGPSKQFSPKPSGNGRRRALFERIRVRLLPAGARRKRPLGRDGRGRGAGVELNAAAFAILRRITGAGNREPRITARKSKNAAAAPLSRRTVIETLNVPVDWEARVELKRKFTALVAELGLSRAEELLAAIRARVEASIGS